MDPHIVSYAKHAPGSDVVVESYEHGQDTRRHIVTERTGLIRNGESIDVMCRFTVTPSGYDEVSITIHKNEQLAYEWTVSREEMMSCISSQSQDPSESPTILLVDGPNPMFNWLNVRLLAALPSTGSSSMEVLQLMYRTKTMKVVRYTVTDNDGVLTIDRGAENGTVIYFGLPSQFFPDKILEGADVTYTRA